VYVYLFRIISSILILIWIDTQMKKDIEICAVKLHISSRTTVIITVYRSPTGNTSYFLDNLEAV